MKLDPWKADVKLGLDEWTSLLKHSARYEFRKRIESSPLYSLFYSSLEVILDNAKKISARGRIAKIKLTRIMARLFAALINKNQAAFEEALKDLIELGKSV